MAFLVGGMQLPVSSPVSASTRALAQKVLDFSKTSENQFICKQPSNTRNNMKSQIKNKSNQSFNFGILISTLNERRRDQCLLALLEGKNHKHLQQNNHSSYLNYLFHPLSFIVSQGLLYVMFFSIKRIKKNSIICNKFLLLLKIS